MTEDQWVNSQLELWGFDYIEALYNDGYNPVLTDRGWKWVKYEASESDSTLTRQLPQNGMELSRS